MIHNIYLNFAHYKIHFIIFFIAIPSFLHENSYNTESSLSIEAIENILTYCILLHKHQFYLCIIIIFERIFKDNDIIANIKNYIMKTLNFFIHSYYELDWFLSNTKLFDEFNKLTIIFFRWFFVNIEIKVKILLGTIFV